MVVSFAGVMRWMLRDVRADLGGRIDRPERHVDRVDARMDRLETRMDGRMDRLETRLDSLAADLRTVSDRLARIEGAAGGPWPRPDTATAAPSQPAFATNNFRLTRQARSLTVLDPYPQSFRMSHPW